MTHIPPPTKEALRGIVRAVGLTAGSLIAANELIDAVASLYRDPIRLLECVPLLLVIVFLVLQAAVADVFRIENLSKTVARRASRIAFLGAVASGVVWLSVTGGMKVVQKSEAVHAYKNDPVALEATAIDLHGEQASPLNDREALQTRMNRVQSLFQTVLAASQQAGISLTSLLDDADVTLGSLHPDIKVQDVAPEGQTRSFVRIGRWVQHGPMHACLFGKELCPALPMEDQGGFAVSASEVGAGGSLQCALHPTLAVAYAGEDGSITIAFGGDVALDGAASGAGCVALMKLSKSGLTLDKSACPDVSNQKRQSLLDYSDGFVGVTNDMLLFRRDRWLDEHIPFDECHACEHVTERSAYRWNPKAGQFVLARRSTDNTPFAWFVRFVNSYPFIDDAAVKEFLGDKANVGVVADFLEAASARKCSTRSRQDDERNMYFDCDRWLFEAKLTRGGPTGYRLESLVKTLQPSLPPYSKIQIGGRKALGPHLIRTYAYFHMCRH